MATFINHAQKSFAYGIISGATLAREGQQVSAGVTDLLNYKVNTDFSISPRKGSKDEVFQQEAIDDFYKFKGVYFIRSGNQVSAIIKKDTGNLKINFEFNLNFNKAYDLNSGEEIINDRIKYINKKDILIEGAFPQKTFKKFEPLQGDLYVFFEESLPFKFRVEGSTLYLLPYFSYSGHSSIAVGFPNFFSFSGQNEALLETDLTYFKDEKGNYLKLSISDTKPKLFVFDEDLDAGTGKVSAVPGVYKKIEDLNNNTFFVNKEDISLREFLGHPFIMKVGLGRGFFTYEGSFWDNLGITIYADDARGKYPEADYAGWGEKVQNMVKLVYPNRGDIPYRSVRIFVGTDEVYEKYFDIDRFIRAYGGIFVRHLLVVPETVYEEEGVEFIDEKYLDLKNLYNLDGDKIVSSKIGANCSIVELSIKSNYTETLEGEEVRKIGSNVYGKGGVFSDAFFVHDWYKDVPQGGFSVSGRLGLYTKNGLLSRSDSGDERLFSSPINALEAFYPEARNPVGHFITSIDSRFRFKRSDFESFYLRRYLNFVESGDESVRLDRYNGNSYLIKDSDGERVEIKGVTVARLGGGNTGDLNQVVYFTNKGIFYWRSDASGFFKKGDMSFKSSVVAKTYRNKLYFTSSDSSNLYFLSYVRDSGGIDAKPVSVTNMQAFSDLKDFLFFDEDKFLILKNDGTLLAGLSFSNELIGISRWDNGRKIKSMHLEEGKVVCLTEGGEQGSRIFSFEGDTDFGEKFNCEVELLPIGIGYDGASNFTQVKNISKVILIADKLKTIQVKNTGAGGSFKTLVRESLKQERVQKLVSSHDLSVNLVAQESLRFRHSNKDVENIGGIVVRYSYNEVR